MEEFDFFISHASADKADFVGPFAYALVRAGYRVWYDELSIKPGESIRRSIDSGIAKSSAGIVVLSRAFFDRAWPQAELDALLALHIGQKKRIIPIWLGLDHQDVAAVSPLMADKKAIKASASLSEVVQSILETLPIAPASSAEIEYAISVYRNELLVNQERLVHQCLRRICAVAQFADEYEQALNQVDVDEDGDDEADDLFEARMSKWWDDALERLGMPRTVYFDEPQDVSEDELGWALRSLEVWARGRLSWRKTAGLYFWLDESIDADYLFVFFGIPLKRVQFEQRDKLHQAIIDIGTRNLERAKPVDFRTAFDHAFRRWYAFLKREKQRSP